MHNYSEEEHEALWADQRAKEGVEYFAYRLWRDRHPNMSSEELRMECPSQWLNYEDRYQEEVGKRTVAEHRALTAPLPGAPAKPKKPLAKCRTDQDILELCDQEAKEAEDDPLMLKHFVRCGAGYSESDDLIRITAAEETARLNAEEQAKTKRI
jgi:hypothetical protein